MPLPQIQGIPEGIPEDRQVQGIPQCIPEGIREDRQVQGIQKGIQKDKQVQGIPEGIPEGIQKEGDFEMKLEHIIMLIVIINVGVICVIILYHDALPKRIECPIVYSNGTIIMRDCGIDNKTCAEIGCRFGRWSCGRPACYCD